METATPRVALVTGRSGGIGRAVSERLAKDGMAVAVNYAGNKTRAKEVVEAITQADGRAMTVPGDVADEGAMAEAFDAVEQNFGGIDVVVHTAGLMILGPLADFDLEKLDRMHRTNIRGTWWPDGDEEEASCHRGWVREAAEALAPHSLPGGYPNLLGPDEREQIAHAYGPNARRLLAAKERYDPDAVFEAIPLPG